jgi:tRNA(Ile2) C34 agmatinyltransferase TiaS
MTIKVFGWVLGKKIKTEDLRAEAYVRPEAPTNCPGCNGRIELKGGDEYVCIGLTNRQEIEKFHPHGLKLPQSVTELPPCGWHAKAEDYGKTWM